MSIGEFIGMSPFRSFYFTFVLSCQYEIRTLKNRDSRERVFGREFSLNEILDDFSLLQGNQQIRESFSSRAFRNKNNNNNNNALPCNPSLVTQTPHKQISPPSRFQAFQKPGCSEFGVHFTK